MQTLNGLKSGKDRTRRPWVVLRTHGADAHGIRVRADFHRALSRLPAAVSRRRRLGRVREPTLLPVRPSAGSCVLFGT